MLQTALGNIIDENISSWDDFNTISSPKTSGECLLLFHSSVLEYYLHFELNVPLTPQIPALGNIIDENISSWDDFNTISSPKTSGECLLLFHSSVIEYYLHFELNVPLTPQIPVKCLTYWSQCLGLYYNHFTLCFPTYSTTNITWYFMHGLAAWLPLIGWRLVSPCHSSIPQAKWFTFKSMYQYFF